MNTPLYKFLKEQGTTFYAFPGASEDISAAYQNDNYTMNFSKFTLLNIPKRVLTSGINNDPIKMDFSVFPKGTLMTPPTFSEELVESLRNYVANHEIVLRSTRVGANEYFYDNNLMQTTTERIFWKWCKKLNILDVELASELDEYISTNQEFESNNLNDITYFPEHLWRERLTIPYRVVQAYETGSLTNPGNLEIEFNGSTNFRVGDIITFDIFSNVNLTILNNLQLTILEVIPPSMGSGQKVVLDYTYSSGTHLETTGVSMLVYEKLVNYIGEITAVNNVQEENRAYTEVYAHIGAHLGKTPTVLFRTISDANYSPNLQFPLLPIQFQPEIIGAQNFSSPIISNPQDYPGGGFGQFDAQNFTYRTSNGDSLRRSGDYYGIFGDTTSKVVDASNIDGLTIDFDQNHYSKMNIINKEVSTFDEFNALAINNQPPKDFEFNAILWYYTVEDNNGNTATNLYGVTFLDNPANSIDGLKIPTYKKLVNDGTKDGTSYSFSLNLNFNIINDNIQPSFNPNNVNSLFSFNLFNEAMTRLASANNSFNNVIAENSLLKTEIMNIKQLIYTQTDLNTINSRINNLESLLTLYQTMQIVSTDSISVTTTAQTPPLIQLNSIDGMYKQIDTVFTTSLYSPTGIIPYIVSVPENKPFLLNIINNDDTNLSLGNDKLAIVLDRDLDYKQSVDIIIEGDVDSTQNKMLDIYLTFSDGSENEVPIQTELITSINLPIYFNEDDQNSNYAYLNNQDRFKVDLSSDITFETGDILRIPMDSTIGFKKGDVFVLNNFILASGNYSGQYLVEDVTTLYIDFDITMNQSLVDYYNTALSIPYLIHDAMGVTELVAQPYLSLNKGYKYKITRVSNIDTSTIEERYLIEGGAI